MTDVKYKNPSSLIVGVDAGDNTIITAIISLKDRIVPVEGELVKPFAAINDKTAIDVTHHQRYVEIELITDGWNYEAHMTQQVVDGDSDSRAFRQGADNDPIGHLVGTYAKVGGSDIVTYESERGFLSGLHIHVTNRKGTKYQPCTFRYKVRGSRT